MRFRARAASGAGPRRRPRGRRAARARRRPRRRRAARARRIEPCRAALAAIDRALRAGVPRRPALVPRPRAEPRAARRARRSARSCLRAAVPPDARAIPRARRRRHAALQPLRWHLRGVRRGRRDRAPSPGDDGMAPDPHRPRRADGGRRGDPGPRAAPRRGTRAASPRAWPSATPRPRRSSRRSLAARSGATCGRPWPCTRGWGPSWHCERNRCTRRGHPSTCPCPGAPSPGRGRAARRSDRPRWPRGTPRSRPCTCRG